VARCIRELVALCGAGRSGNVFAKIRATEIYGIGRRALGQCAPSRGMNRMRLDNAWHAVVGAQAQWPSRGGT
jgi:hypothetical protein